MGDYFGEYDEETNELDESEAFTPLDPFDGLSKREQDVFFRVLDLLPREQLETAMEYFMDHPDKIRAVINYVKQKKELLDTGDTEGLNALFEQERILIETLQTQHNAHEQEVEEQV
jgi:hypothetical protein